MNVLNIQSWFSIRNSLFLKFNFLRKDFLPSSKGGGEQITDMLQDF